MVLEQVRFKVESASVSLEGSGIRLVSGPSVIGAARHSGAGYSEGHVTDSEVTWPDLVSCGDFNALSRLPSNCTSFVPRTSPC